MLKIKNLETYYGKIQALKGISLNVSKGDITCLLGGNGSGKSTALKSVVGLVSPASGSIEFINRSIFGMSPEKVVKMGISLIPQGREIFPKMTVDENIELGAFIRKDHDEIKQDIDNSLQLFPGLKKRQRQLAGTMSGGEQQMLAICRGLMSRPKLLLMDEPSAGLAPMIVEQIYGVIKKLYCEGMTILLVEHNIRAALSISNFCYILRNGEIVAAENPETLINNPDLKASYLGG